MSRTTLAVIILFTCLESCKRESYPQPIMGTPEFTMTGQKDGQPFSLIGGASGVFVNATVAQNVFGVYEFDCDFVRSGCSACAPILTVEINDDHVLAPEAPVSPDVFQPGIFQFATDPGESSFLTVEFDAPPVPGGNYHWQFGDGDESSDHNTEHTYDSAGTYSVTLHVEPGGGPGSAVTITQTIIVGSEEIASLAFDIHPLPENEWEFSYPGMLPPYLQITTWTVNGELHTGDHYHYEPEDPGPIEACLTFYNTFTETYGQYCVTFDSGPGPGPCLDNFAYQWHGESVNLQNVELSFTSAEGGFYTSVIPMNGSPDHRFNITSVSEYPHLVNGRPARKISALFDVWLENIDNPSDKIHFQNMEADLVFIY